MEICVLLGMSALVTTLKTFFSNSLAIFFHLDVVYWVGGVSTFLINISNLFIRKQISDGAIILACSEYFPSHPQSCLTEAKEAKFAEDDLAAGTSI